MTEPDLQLGGDQGVPGTIVWDHATLARFWAYYARQPDAYFSYRHGGAVVKAAARYLQPGVRVLDYGCGPGYLVAHLLDAGFQVTGADFAIDATGDTATRHAGRAGFGGVSTIDALLGTGRQFDSVFLLEVVEHLYEKDLELTFHNVRRLLAPGGHLIVTTPNEERLEDNMVYCPVSNLVFHRWQHVRSWSAATLQAAIEARGLTVRVAEARNFQFTSGALTLRSLAVRTLERLQRGRTLFAVAQRPL